MKQSESCMICLEECDTVIRTGCRCKMIVHPKCFNEWYKQSACCLICKQADFFRKDDLYCMKINYSILEFCVKWIHHCAYIVYQHESGIHAYTKLLLCAIITSLLFMFIISPLLFVNEIAMSFEKIIRIPKKNLYLVEKLQ
jgi:hypothetical protein